MNQNSLKNGLIVTIHWDNEKNYSGFDGKKVWPHIDASSIILDNGLASIDQLDQIVEYQKNFKESRLVYIQMSKSIDEVPKEINNRFAFVGYDYGSYLAEYNYYSLIFHEIISGQKEEFKDYAKYLNKNLLFSSLEHIPTLEKTNIELRAKGEDLEDEDPGEEYQPIAVYVYNERN
jgi:hypothetical protein